MEKIGSRIGAGRDFRGRPLTIERAVLFRKLQKQQIKWTKEKGREALFKAELERLRGIMGIPRPCVEQALEIYKQALEKELTISVEAMAAAALYLACRMMKMPRPLDEIVKYANASKEKVARYCRLLLRELNVKVPVSDPVLYVSRIAEQLKLSGEVVKTAIEILQKARKARITAGKDPAGLAAAAVYMAALMHGEHRALKDFASAAGVAGITVRNRYYELINLSKRSVENVAVDRKVKIVGGSAEVVESTSGRKLLKIRITAEVDGVRREYVITFGRYGADNAIKCYAYLSADAPGGREADAERLAAVIKALTGEEPRIYRRQGAVIIACSRRHLERLRHFVEFAEAVEKWLEQ